MKTSIPVALGATCLGIHLSNKWTVDGFVIAGTARATSQWTPSSVKARGLRRGREASFATCRMSGAVDGQGRPKKGFGQPQASDKGSKGKKKAAAAEAAEEASSNGSNKRQLLMQFTCNMCEGVSQYMINKDAYEEGIVICTCQTCNVKHLLADNLKKMDVPEFGNNIEEYMGSIGSPEEVTKGKAPGLTPEVLEKYDVSLGKDGTLNLSPKADIDS